jgi:hypothetical protein
MVKVVTIAFELLGLLLVAGGISAIVWHYTTLPVGVIVLGALLLVASYIIAHRGDA